MLKYVTWNRVKWAFRGLVALIVVLFLHYTLPQHDVVRITDVYTRIIHVGTNRIFYSAPDVGTQPGDKRDVLFISALRPNGKVIVYRNEDTGWIWPPYFKYDSSNLQARAAQFKSTSKPYQWVVITHYGWRIPLITIFPNVVGIRPVDSPDVRIIPWFNIIFLTFLGLLYLWLRRKWRQFRRQRIDPALESIDDSAGAASAHARGLWVRFRGWLASFGGGRRR